MHVCVYVSVLMYRCSLQEIGGRRWERSTFRGCPREKGKEVIVANPSETSNKFL